MTAAIKSISKGNKDLIITVIIGAIFSVGIEFFIGCIVIPVVYGNLVKNHPEKASLTPELSVFCVGFIKQITKDKNSKIIFVILFLLHTGLAFGVFAAIAFKNMKHYEYILDDKVVKKSTNAKTEEKNQHNDDEYIKTWFKFGGSNGIKEAIENANIKMAELLVIDYKTLNIQGFSYDKAGRPKEVYTCQNPFECFPMENLDLTCDLIEDAFDGFQADYVEGKNITIEWSR